MHTHRHLWDTYDFPGCRLTPTVPGIFGDPKASVIHLCRCEKTACGVCGQVVRSWYDRKTGRVRNLPCGDTWVYLTTEICCIECKTCGKVRQETVDWLVDNPFDNQRFVFFVGRRCRIMTGKDGTEETRLDWNTIKAPDKPYMLEPLFRAGAQAPKIARIDEVSIRKGHTYRLVVSDLERRRPIWFWGKDCSAANMDEFSQWLGVAKSKTIRLAVRDM